MKEQLTKLITVKSVITIFMSVLVFILALRGDIPGEEVTRLYTIIIAFYFGTQHEKQKEVIQNAGNTKEIDTNK